VWYVCVPVCALNICLLCVQCCGFMCSNAYMSPQQDSGIHMMPNGNDTRSLPDLSDLQFTAGSTLEDVGCSTGHQIGPMRSGSQSSPGSRHRRSRTGPKPLFLPSSTCVPQYQVSISIIALVCLQKVQKIHFCIAGYVFWVF
jgi:hypothetical protein